MFFCWVLGIVTASADCSILATDVETGAQVAHLENAHEYAIIPFRFLNWIHL